jgi:hypothetical protein
VGDARVTTFTLWPLYINPRNKLSRGWQPEVLCYWSTIIKVGIGRYGRERTKGALQRQTMLFAEAVV